MGLRNHLIPALVCLLVLPCVQAKALEGAKQTTDSSSLSLISATNGAGSAATLQAGMDLSLQPGWHSFWRMPGEGGLSPKFDWSQSVNVKSVTVHWPTPRRFDQMGLYSFGYNGETLFPLDVAVASPGKETVLKLAADIMVCKDICVPQHITATLTIPAGPAKAAPEALRIASAFKTLPHQGDTAWLRIDSAVIGPKALVVRAWGSHGLDGAELVAEVQDGAFYFTAKPDVTPDAKDPRAGTITLAPPDGTGNMADALMHHKVTLTLIKGDTAIEKAIDF